MRSIIKIMLVGAIFIMGGEDKNITLYARQCGGVTQVSPSFHSSLIKQNMTFPHCHEAQVSKVNAVKLNEAELSQRALEAAIHLKHLNSMQRTISESKQELSDLERNLRMQLKNSDDKQSKMFDSVILLNLSHLNDTQSTLNEAQKGLSELRSVMLMDLKRFNDTWRAIRKAKQELLELRGTV
jgi:hypothetical protein